MNARRLDRSDLEMFLATARGGSLAAAAGALGLDASTVHRRMGKLESAMHTRLFDRSQRGYSLTSAGEELLAHAEAMDEQVAAARRKVVARDDALTGVVRVATVDGLAIGVLAPIFGSFREAHPSVTVAVDLNPGLTDLAREPAEVAIRLVQKAPDGDVIVKPACKCSSTSTSTAARACAPS
jgi:DNA-binding transcriptional LysR family regulator